MPRQTLSSQPYWEGCREGELRLQQCDSCDRYQFYPRVICSHCGHDQLIWRVASGRGKIASYTVIHRPVSDAYPAPSVILLVDLEEGPRMMSSLASADPQAVHVGAEVIAEFSPWSEDVTLPVFRVLTEESQS